MTTSNKYGEFNSVFQQLAIEALELCGVYSPYEGLQNEDQVTVFRTLDFMMKAWQANGLYLWTYKNATLFMQKDTLSYRLGPGGDHATESYTQTALAANAAGGAGTISLASTAGILASDNIGIVLDSGAIFWTTVNNPATTTITSNLPSTASSGSKVYIYTTKIQRPLKITDAYVRSGNLDTPIRGISREDYARLSNKYTASKPSQIFYDPQTTNGVLYVWPICNNVTDKLCFSYKKPIQDIGSQGLNPDYPLEWLEPVSIMLADKIAPKYNVSAADRNDLSRRAMVAMSEISDFEETSIFIRPSR